MRRIWLGLALVSISTLTGQSSLAKLTICTPGPYIIFFKHGSSIEGENVGPILDNVVPNHDGCPDARMVIDGHIAAGEPEALSMARAEMVWGYLVAKGIARKQLYLRDLGSTEPRNNDPAISARVRIYFEPP